MAKIIPISELTAHQRVALRLRSMLVEGQLPPGGKLNERALCESLGVSRTPLREAVKLLASEGLIDLLPNRGAVAVSMSRLDVEHTFETLAELEAMGGEWAATRITADELAEIRALHYEMLACYTRRDLPSYYRLNSAIHGAINAAAKNPVLTETYRRINARVQSLRFRSNQDEARWQQAVGEHEAMLGALAAGDGKTMARLMSEHLNRKRDAVLSRFGAVHATLTD